MNADKALRRPTVLGLLLGSKKGRLLINAHTALILTWKHGSHQLPFQWALFSWTEYRQRWPVDPVHALGSQNMLRVYLSILWNDCVFSHHQERSDAATKDEAVLNKSLQGTPPKACKRLYVKHTATILVCFVMPVTHSSNPFSHPTPDTVRTMSVAAESRSSADL